MFFAQTVFNQKFKISGQLALVLTLIFGMHSTAYGKRRAPKFTPQYKVENCDCVGFSEDIPTFLSTLTGGRPDIYGEGKSMKAAEKKAEMMCKETYRGYASASKTEHPESVSFNDCDKMKSTPEGDWVAYN